MGAAEDSAAAAMPPPSRALAMAVAGLRQAALRWDPCVAGGPIVAASDGFLSLSGHVPKAVVGTPWCVGCRLIPSPPFGGPSSSPARPPPRPLGLQQHAALLFPDCLIE